MTFIKNILFIITTIYAGIIDYKTREIPNKVHIIILLLSLININLKQSLIGLILLPIPFIIPIFIDYNSVGGGDIKLIGAMGAFLGFKKGIIALIISLTLALILNLLIFKKNKKEIFPLAPYMAIGSFITILLLN